MEDKRYIVKFFHNDKGFEIAADTVDIESQDHGCYRWLTLDGQIYQANDMVIVCDAKDTDKIVKLIFDSQDKIILN